ncbi:NAD(P)-binding domain-containing protein [Rugosimonospora acidiphila]|uniref:NAD(P)-binding domain-containing protein n=1 Tax=Rugosimonospora acidiphila TaxID=556531 RepID=A0ABP9SBN1_9ACTN
MLLNIVGSGNMARAIAARAAFGDHQVRIINPNLDHARALVTDLRQRFSGADIGVGESVGQADLNVLAVHYPAGQEIVQSAGNELDDQIVVDIANPVDMSTFDSLTVPAGSSAAEEIQQAAGGSVRVVKAFNTIFADLLEAGEGGGERLDVLIAGDDDDAKSTVAQFVSSTDMHPMDVGPLRRSRELEAMEFLHMTMQQPLGLNQQSAIKIVS